MRSEKHKRWVVGTPGGRAAAAPLALVALPQVYRRVLQIKSKSSQLESSPAESRVKQAHG